MDASEAVFGRSIFFNIHQMNLLREKMLKYDAPQRAKAAGIYPYFRAIESDQDTEVIINGKKVLMFGSNAYLG